MHKYWGYIGCFAALTAALTLGDMLQKDRFFSETENRILEQRPEPDRENVLNGSWSKEYEAYLTDQFVGRDGWIGMKTRSEKWMGKKDINGVYLAKDGYLIERHSGASIDADAARRKAEKLAADVSGYRQILTRGNPGRAGQVRVMLTPTADVILSDKLPAFARDFDQLHYLAGLDKLLWEEDGGKTARVRVEETLTAHSGEDIYYRTDHHWTTLGAYYGYTAWADSMGLQAVPAEEYSQKTVSDSFLGTLHSKINLPVLPDSITLFVPKNGSSCRVRYDLEEDTSDSLYALERLDTKNQYGVFLDDNHALVQIDTQDDRNGKRGGILVIKDSYANCFAPFLTAHYDTVYLLDKRYYHGSVDAFLEEHPVDDVLILYDVIHFLENY